MKDETGIWITVSSFVLLYIPDKMKGDV